MCHCNPRFPNITDTWIAALVMVGASGVFLTAWLAKRAGDAQMQANNEIHQAEVAASNANVAATDANKAATDASRAATDAQNETRTARKEAHNTQEELSQLVNKRSRETTQAFIKLNATTESSVKGISRPRRIPEEMKSRLVGELSGHKGVVTINCIGGEGESMQFANDWHEVLSRAGWTITSAVNVIVTPDLLYGVRIQVRGEPIAANESFNVPASHPAAALGRALWEVTRDVIGQRQPQLPENTTVLDIGVLPRPGN